MMQGAGQSLAKKTDALIKEYHRQSNIQQTIEALSQAFPGRDYQRWPIERPQYFFFSSF